MHYAVTYTQLTVYILIQVSISRNTQTSCFCSRKYSEAEKKLVKKIEVAYVGCGGAKVLANASLCRSVGGSISLRRNCTSSWNSSWTRLAFCAMPITDRLWSYGPSQKHMLGQIQPAIGISERKMSNKYVQGVNYWFAIQSKTLALAKRNKHN